MDGKLIIGISGKKQSGKTSLCDFLRSKIWCFSGNLDYKVNQDNLGNISFYDNKTSEEKKVDLSDWNFCQFYNFADKLKKDICIGILGLTERQVYGTDEDKNALTEYYWDDMPDHIRFKYSNKTEEIYSNCQEKNQADIINVPRTGRMTSRDLMKIIGTDIFRDYFDDDIWINCVFSQIKKDNPSIAIIPDVRFQSEVDAVINHGGYIIRLNRSVAGEDNHKSEIDLDYYDFSSLGEKAFFLDNNYLKIEDKNNVVWEWVSDKIIPIL